MSIRHGFEHRSEASQEQLENGLALAFVPAQALSVSSWKTAQAVRPGSIETRILTETGCGTEKLLDSARIHALLFVASGAAP